MMKIFKFTAATIVLAVAFAIPAMADGFDSSLFTLSGSNSNGYVTNISTSGFTLVGSNNYSYSGGDTSYSTTFTSAGTLSFDWTATTNDWNLSYDPASATLSGSYLLYAGSGCCQNGSIAVNYNPGDTLTFNIHTVDNIYGASSLDVSNYTTTPEPTSLVLLGTGLVGLARKLRKV